MERGSYAFTLGMFHCLAIRDGGLNYPVEAMFANAPRLEVDDALRRAGLPTDRVTTPYTCLYVDTGRHRVLIDTGAGALAAAAPMVFPSVDHTTSETGLLHAHLAAADIAASTIDTVIITHAHPDHVDGTLDADNTLVYAHAQYLVPETEWTFWFSTAAETAAPPVMVTSARRNLEAMRERMRLVRDGDEVVPGIRAIHAPGHTPGHTALAITSNDELLLHLSDVVLHPLHLLHPDWVPVFDMDPTEAARSKQRMVDRAARDEALVFAHHFSPFPSLGHIHQQGAGWKWLPVS